MTGRPAHLVVTLVAVLCVLAAAGCGGSRAEAKRYSVHLQRGVEAYERGDYERALNAFHKALQFNPDDPNLYLYIGELYDDYFEDKIEAIAYYKGFLKRSTDKKLNARVERWIAQAEADLAGTTPETTLVTPSDPEQELRELRTKHAQVLMELSKYRAGARTHEVKTGTRAPLVPWLIAGICGGGAVGVLLLARIGWLGVRSRVAPTRDAGPVLDEQLILGRYFWVENEFNLGTVSIDREDGKIRVESTSLSTNARSIGYGRLEKEALRTELTDESGLTASTVFRFSPDGMSFTAEWTDDLGPGVAIGVRER